MYDKEASGNSAIRLRTKGPIELISAVLDISTSISDASFTELEEDAEDFDSSLCETFEKADLELLLKCFVSRFKQ